MFGCGAVISASQRQLLSGEIVGRLVNSKKKGGEGKVEAQHPRYNFYVELVFKQTAEVDYDCKVMMMAR